MSKTSYLLPIDTQNLTDFSLAENFGGQAEKKDRRNDAAGLLCEMYGMLLDSVEMVWRRTPDRLDELRAAVIELVKDRLNALCRLRSFQALTEQVLQLRDDVSVAPKENELEVRWVPGNYRAGVRFA